MPGAGPSLSRCSASLGTTGAHVSSSHCDGSRTGRANDDRVDAGAVERLGLPQDGVGSGVVRHHDERRHLDVRRIATDLVAVPAQDVHLVRDGLGVADDVAGVGVGRDEPQASCAPHHRRSRPAAAAS